MKHNFKKFALVLLFFGLLPCFVFAKGTTVIQVNDVPITKERIDSLVVLLGRQQFGEKALTKEEYEYLVKIVAGNLVSQELLYAEAKSQKIPVGKAEVDSVMAVFKSSFGDNGGYEKALKQVGDSEKSLREKMERQIKMEKLLASIVSAPARPNEGEMKQYFEKNKDKFPKNKKLRGSQILLKLGKGKSADEEKTKREKLEKIREHLLAEPHIDILLEKFARLAALHSEGEEAQLGGDLGTFELGDFMPDFDKNVKNLKVGEISPVFKTPLGLHLFLLTDKNDKSFENSKLKIMQIYVLEKTRENQEKLEGYLQTLYKKFNVKYLNPQYKGELSSDLNAGGLQ